MNINLVNNFSQLSKRAIRQTMFRQNNINDCFLMAPLKSTMFALNEYASVTKNRKYNANGWMKKLVRFDDKGNAEIFFPLLINFMAKVDVSKNNVRALNSDLAKGNKRVSFLEYGYGLLTKAIDFAVNDKKDIVGVIDNGVSFLALRDITGLK